MWLLKFYFLWINMRVLYHIQWYVRKFLFLLIKVKLTKSLVFLINDLAKAILGSRRRIEISWIAVLIVNNTSIVLNLRQCRLFRNSYTLRMTSSLFAIFVHIGHLLLTTIISCHTLFNVSNSVIINTLLYVHWVISFLYQLAPIWLIIGVSNWRDLFIFLHISNSTIVLFLLVVKALFVSYLTVF